MTDAESTIRGAILDGYVSVTEQPRVVEARVDAILECISKPQYRWAIITYLAELAKQETSSREKMVSGLERSTK